MINRRRLALYEIQYIRPETMRGGCMSFWRLISRVLITAPHRAKIRLERRALKGTSFAESRAMIVIAHQAGHQWRAE
jgi:hypothetical protein